MIGVLTYGCGKDVHACDK